MAKYKKNIKGDVPLSNNKIKETPASTEASDFVENQIEREINQIKTEMQEESYRSRLNSLMSKENDIEKDTDSTIYQAKRKRGKKEKKPYEHTTFAHKMRVLAVLLVLGVFCGSGLGVWYFNLELRSTFNPFDYVAEDYMQSVDETFKKNNINATQNDKLGWLDKIGDLTPAHLSTADNFILAEYNLTLANSYVIDGTGGVDTIVKQTITSRKKYNGSYYTFENISISGNHTLQGDTLTCDKYNKNGKTVSVYTSTKSSPNVGDWNHSKDMEVGPYLQEKGNLPNAITPYIISEKTVSPETNDKSTIIDNGNGTYTFTMHLDKKTSVLNYSKQVRQTGGLNSFPEFEYIYFTATIDSDWNLLTFSIREKYSATKIVATATCVGTLDYTVTINGDVEMPV